MERHLGNGSELPTQVNLCTETGVKVVHNFSDLQGMKPLQTRQDVILEMTRDTLTSVYDGVATYKRQCADTIYFAMGNKEVFRLLRRSIPREHPGRRSIRKCRAFVLAVQNFVESYDHLDDMGTLGRANLLHAEYLCRKNDARRLSSLSAVNEREYDGSAFPAMCTCQFN